MTSTVYVGLDLHAETIAVATADDGRNGEIRFYGTIRNTADSILRLTKWSCHAYVPASQLIYAAFLSNAKGLLPPSDEWRRRGL
jgi:hypothetical protein